MTGDIEIDLAFAVLRRDEEQVLRLILNELCRKSKVRERFEELTTAAVMAAPHYSNYGQDLMPQYEMMERIRAFVNAHEPSL